MIEKLLRVRFKTSGETEYYRKYCDIYKSHTEEEIGCCVGNMYNLACKNGGNYENKNVKVDVIDCVLASYGEDGELYKVKI